MRAGVRGRAIRGRAPWRRVIGCARAALVVRSLVRSPVRLVGTSSVLMGLLLLLRLALALALVAGLSNVSVMVQ